MFKKTKQPLPDSEGRLSEHLPWLVHVSPELVLNKDGSIMGAFELEGVDIDDDGGYELSKALAEMQDALQTLDERYYIWIVTDKRRKTQENGFEVIEHNLVSSLIEERNQIRYHRGEVFTLKTYVFMLFTGDAGVYRFMDNVRQRMSEDGSSLLAAIAYALNPANTTKSAALYDARQLDVNIRQAQTGFDVFIHAHSALRFRRLVGTELDAALYRSANPTLNLESNVDVHPGSILDSTMSASDLRFGREVFAVHGPNRTQ